MRLQIYKANLEIKILLLQKTIIKLHSFPFISIIYKELTPKAFQQTILKWYDQNQRDLPWRKTLDPYKIWLSEIILQQTRVNQGLPYYHSFIKKYPLVELLANAEEKDVLRLWQGLGYYSRARNLHACSKEIVEKYGGFFPQTYSEIIKLKGIGPYTAAAIASFAYKEPVAVVDGNVTRVLARVYGIDKDFHTPEGKKIFWDLAGSLIDKQNPDQYNQAIMEFGAVHCTPANPSCADCVFKNGCFANIHKLQKLLPVKKKKTKVTARYFQYLVIEYDGKLLFKRRDASDIWQGLYDFYLIENRNSIEESKNRHELFGIVEKNKSTLVSVSEIYTHKLSHQLIQAVFFHYKIIEECLAVEILKCAKLAFYSIEEVIDLPKPILVQRYLQEKFI